MCVYGHPENWKDKRGNCIVCHKDGHPISSLDIQAFRRNILAEDGIMFPDFMSKSILTLRSKSRMTK